MENGSEQHTLKCQFFQKLEMYDQHIIRVQQKELKMINKSKINLPKEECVIPCKSLRCICNINY